MSVKEKRRRTFHDFLANPWIPAALSVLLIGAILLHLFQNRNIFTSRSGEAPPERESKRQDLEEALVRFKLNDQVRIVRTRPVETWRIRLPADIAFLNIHLALQEKFDPAMGWQLEGRNNPPSDEIALDISWKDSCYFHLVFIRDDRPSVEGRIAIIIDDFGDHWDSVVEAFLDLPFNVTISILPGRPMSRRVAKSAAEKGHEILMHQPMEPLTGTYSRENMILSQMTPEEIEKTVQKSLADVPGAVGTNNHMGSRVTSNRLCMTLFLKEIKKRDLFFVDSRTTAETVAFDVAREMGIPCSKRDVFLDVEPGMENIRKSFRLLMERAREQREAIGIGHCTQTTLEIMKEEIPGILKQGYQLITVSEMVR